MPPPQIERIQLGPHSVSALQRPQPRTLSFPRPRPHVPRRLLPEFNSCPRPLLPAPLQAPARPVPDAPLQHPQLIGNPMAELLDLTQCEDFFGHCPVHAAHPPRECQLNFFDLSTHSACCALCVAAQPLDTYIQVRRSSYHDVVKVQDISRFADISGVQGYTINSSKVIFLRRRPQPRPPKGAVGASLCTVCTRHLQDVSLYCSLQCKLDAAAGVKHVSLRALATAGGPQAHGHTHSSGSSGGGAPGTPSHLAQSLRPGAGPFHPASDSDGMADFHGQPAKRRKGCPHRAPSE